MHPVDSAKIAADILPGLDDKVKPIIESHMWPLNGIMPKFTEGWIIVLADKIVSMEDVMWRET